jgi:hypothetical protein
MTLANSLIEEMVKIMDRIESIREIGC